MEAALKNTEYSALDDKGNKDKEAAADSGGRGGGGGQVGEAGGREAGGECGCLHPLMARCTCVCACVCPRPSAL